ncbi:MAG: diphthamide biosynthesis enzyme Dph2 [Candidatus Bathyarchaeota archaeon]|jgi:2-(3-amino-3-carboxypropyl)histidine synthase|nr:diphthamide biosynthesis enzyme Dph2 [Candidatus Bathyarchaeota archaeon]
MKQFDLEEERIKQEILKLGAKRVLIQLPEGLKPEAPYLSKIVEKTGALPIVSADPCYGACDLAAADAEALGVDLIIHYGHAKMLKYERVPTIYVEARATLNVEAVVEKALPTLEKWRKIGLTTTVQHVQTLDVVREMLLQMGKIVAIGDAGRLNYAGQVIGCDYSNAKSIASGVEVFLFIGGGRFHALGVTLSTSKPTIAADPYEKRVFSVNEEAEKIVKQRWASIEEAGKAKNFAVLVGLKPGQRKLEDALMIKGKLEEKGKAVCLLATKEISPEILMEFPSVNAFVNTACPRVSIDDTSRFKKPLLTVNEALVVVGELSWEDLCKKGWFEN